MPDAWRIVTARFRNLDGKGAALTGGRWNSPGRPVVYAAATLSLAMLELLVRLPLGEVPDGLVRICILLPEDVPEAEIGPRDVPDWNARDRLASRRYGDAWLAGQRSAVLRVPAVAVPHERNVLLNPLHPAFARITAGPPQPMAWDRRLFERGAT